MRALRLAAAAVLALNVPAGAQAPAPEQLAARLVTLTSIVGGDGPQWTPDGSKIVFPSGAALWSVSPDGGQPVKMTGDLQAQIPRISPDGKSVAYLSDKSGSL